MIENKYLLTVKNVKVNEICFPNIQLNSGDIVFIDSKDVTFSNIFISLLFGQVKIKNGEVLFSNTKNSISNYKKISYISNSFFFPNLRNIEDLVLYTASRKGFLPSKIYSEFCRILKLINLDYVLTMDINDVNFNSRKKIITVLTLSLPMLLVVLSEPFIDVDNETKLVFFDEIKKLSVDGSSIIVLASEADDLEYNLYYRSN